MLVLAAWAGTIVLGIAGCDKSPRPPASTQPSTTPAATETPASTPATGEAALPTPAPTPGATEPAAVEPPATVPAAAGLSDYLGEQASDQRTRAHEQSAVFALSDIKTLLAQKDFAGARDAAKGAVKEYADTKYARDLVDVLAESEKQLTAAKESAAQLQAQIDKQSEQEAQARHDRFTQQRDDGVACLNDKNYPSAIYYFQNALKEEDDAEVKGLLEQAVDKSTNPRIAVGDFTVAGDVGVPDAGRSVAEILLTRFDPTRFQLLERARLSALMDERDLALAGILNNPKLLAGKKVKGVKFLVLGSISKLGVLAVSARMVDVAGGEIVQTAEIEAPDAATLQGMLGELAAVLSMTNEQKQTYLADKDRLAQRRAQKEADGREAAEAAARNREAREAYWRQKQREAALQRQQHERDAVIVVGDLKAMIARGLYRQAARYARQAVLDFADTPSAMELTDLRALAEREMIRQAIAQKEADAEAQRQAAALEAHLQFLRFRQDGLAAYRRNDWRQATASFREALRFEESDEVRDLLRKAQLKLKIDEDRAYADAMGRAARAMREGRWGDAMAAYQSAMALRKSDEAKDGIALAKKKLQQAWVKTPEQVAREKKYSEALQSAGDAIAATDYRKAWQQIAEALAADPNGREARDLAARLGPTLGVKAMLDGKEVAGAQITVNGKAQGATTPASFRFKKGQTVRVAVTLPPKGGKTYATDETTFKADENGYEEFSAKIREVKAAVAPVVTPIPTPTVTPTPRPTTPPTPTPPVETPAGKAKKKKYEKALESAQDAIKDADYKAAWEQIEAALGLDPDGEEAKALAEKLGPTLTVTAELGGKAVKGATVTLAGVDTLTTPASLRLKKGQTYEVTVSLPPKAGKPPYTSDHKTITTDRNGHYEFHAVLKEAAPPVTPAPTATPTPDADAAKKKQYDKAVLAAKAAIADKDYKLAWEQIDLALSLVPDGKEARALGEKLGPTLTITSTLDGAEYKGARVTLNGVVQRDATPSAFKLKLGQAYKIEVTIVKRGKAYTTDAKTVTPDKNGNTDFAAVIKETK